jgi:hypothetical protein
MRVAQLHFYVKEIFRRPDLNWSLRGVFTGKTFTLKTKDESYNCQNNVKKDHLSVQYTEVS